ncbi:MAG: rhomboid family intramembrane serine protease [Candidatus Aenigmatarchaeota archaeon]
MRLTFQLIIIMTILFVLENVPGFFETFSFTPNKILIRPWTLITSIFLHANFAHLFYNMLALFFFGMYLESLIGRKNYIKVFLISGIFGNILFLLTTPNPEIPAVGASGAIYGIIGALSSLKPYAIVYVYFVPMPLIVAAFLWAIGSFVGMFFPSSIAHAAHLGGILFGFLYGEYIKRKRIMLYYRRYRYW